MEELQGLSELERRGELTAPESARLNELRGGPQAAPTEAPAAAPPQDYKTFNVLPFSEDESGIRFDSDAGVSGMAKDAYRIGRDFLMTPGDVMTGKTPIYEYTKSGGFTGEYNPEVIRRGAEGASLFGLMGLGGPAPRSVAAGTGRAIAHALNPAKPKAPTVEALKAAATVARDSVKGMGVDYNANAVAKMANKIMEDLAADGNIAEVAPSTFNILRKMAAVPDARGGTPLVQAQNLSAHVRALKGITDPKDATVGGIAAKAIRKWIDETGDPANSSRVLAGDASGVSRALDVHDKNYSAAMRGQTVGAIGRKAEDTALAQGSGSASDRAIRNRILSRILDPENASKAAGYSEAEQGALRGVMKGSRGNRAARRVGKIAGGGAGSLGIPSMIGGGAGLYAQSPTAAVAGAGIPLALGAGARAIAGSGTRRALNRADEMIRMRSPEGEKLMAGQGGAPDTFKDPRKIDALIRALLVARHGGGDAQ